MADGLLQGTNREVLHLEKSWHLKEVLHRWLGEASILVTRKFQPNQTKAVKKGAAVLDRCELEARWRCRSRTLTDQGFCVLYDKAGLRDHKGNDCVKILAEI